MVGLVELVCNFNTKLRAVVDSCILNLHTLILSYARGIWNMRMREDKYVFDFEPGSNL
jgi:hypothetical protein